MLALFESLGWPEIAIILVVALILFGGSQLPKLARRMGRGMHEFQQGLKGAKDEFEKGLTGDDKAEGKKSEEKAKDEKPEAAEPKKDDAPKA